MTKTIYAIMDTKAETIIGGLHVFAHEAAAVRFFGDVASDAQTMVARHIGDHELIQIGHIDEATGQVEPSLAVVITGAAWKAAQTPVEAN